MVERKGECRTATVGYRLGHYCVLAMSKGDE